MLLNRVVAKGNIPQKCFYRISQQYKPKCQLYLFEKVIYLKQIVLNIKQTLNYVSKYNTFLSCLNFYPMNSDQLNIDLRPAQL